MKDYEEASERYRIAAALGNRLPAPTGAEVAVLTIIDNNITSPTMFIVLTEAYQDVAHDAREALAGWCVDELESLPLPPVG